MLKECRICRAIPDFADRAESDGWPPECDELEHFSRAASRLRRCPLCGSYYDWFYDHDYGGGTSEGGTQEWVRRLPPVKVIAMIRDVLNELPFEPFPTLEVDFEQLLREHAEPIEPVAVLMQRLDAAITANAIMGNGPAEQAAWSLGRLKAVKAVPMLVRALANYYLRGSAARALAAMGAAALPKLLAQLEAEPTARTAAACGLGHLARLEPKWISKIQPPLLAYIVAIEKNAYGNEPVSRELAAWVSAVGLTGYSEAAFRALAGLFSHTYGWEREVAIRAISRMGAGAVPALIRLLSDDDRDVVEAAILTLAGIGPAARDALPALDTCPLADTFDNLIARARAAIMAYRQDFVVSECTICRDIPDVTGTTGMPPMYPALQHFSDAAAHLCKCPRCGTYYDFSYNEYPGAPEVGCDPATYELVVRLSPPQAIEHIRNALAAMAALALNPPPTLAADLERLLRDSPRKS